jgi:hypothetical protein
MAFVASARERVERLPVNNPERLILEFLLQNGVGAGRALPWRVIESQLKKHGVRMTREDFQQTHLKSSRENKIFIGSGPSGFFLIQSQSDARKCAAFYRKRIAKETANLENLERLTAEEWPEG